MGETFPYHSARIIPKWKPLIEIQYRSQKASFIQKLKTAVYTGWLHDVMLTTGLYGKLIFLCVLIFKQLTYGHVSKASEIKLNDKILSRTYLACQGTITVSHFWRGGKIVFD